MLVISQHQQLHFFSKNDLISLCTMFRRFRPQAGTLQVFWRSLQMIDSLFGVSHEKQNHRRWFFHDEEVQIQQTDHMFQHELSTLRRWSVIEEHCLTHTTHGLMGSVTNAFMRLKYSDWTFTDQRGNQSQAWRDTSSANTRPGRSVLLSGWREWLVLVTESILTSPETWK